MTEQHRPWLVEINDNGPLYWHSKTRTLGRFATESEARQAIEFELDRIHLGQWHRDPSGGYSFNEGRGGWPSAAFLTNLNAWDRDTCWKEKEEIKRLRAALAFYADYEQYEIRTDGQRLRIENDRGELARCAPGEK